MKENKKKETLEQKRDRLHKKATIKFFKFNTKIGKAIK